MNDFSRLLREGWRSLRSALASIWRIRSRVTPKVWPTSSSVWSRLVPRPKRMRITRSIADQARTIRIPVHMIDSISKIVRKSRQMLNELGREPTPEELAEKLGMPLERVHRVLKVVREPLSLETPIGDEEDSHLGDFIEDKNAILPIDAAFQSNLREATTRTLASLTPREERVLRMRFGIGMNADHTLEEVGQQFSVTRERIRQIEAKALRKLKHPSRSRILRSFLEN